MSITSERKQELIKEYGKAKGDTFRANNGRLRDLTTAQERRQQQDSQ